MHLRVEGELWRRSILWHYTKEITKNVLKGAFPIWIDRVRKTSGRGASNFDAEELTLYCKQVVDGHLEMGGIRDPEKFLHGRTVVEIGPGDTLATGLFFVAYGAAQYIAVDRFILDVNTPFNTRVYRTVLDSLSGSQRERVERVLLRSSDGFALDSNVRVVRQEAENMDVGEPAGLVVSQSALEHVTDLAATFRRIAATLDPTGLTIHQVGLGDHDLYPGDPLKFLTIPPRLWSAMTCYRGGPNRVRYPEYKRLVQKCGMTCKALRIEKSLPDEVIEKARPRLHASFRQYTNHELGAIGLRFVAAHARAG